jgi:hypothetical protein
MAFQQFFKVHPSVWLSRKLFFHISSIFLASQTNVGKNLFLSFLFPPIENAICEEENSPTKKRAKEKYKIKTVRERVKGEGGG